MFFYDNFGLNTTHDNLVQIHFCNLPEFFGCTVYTVSSHSSMFQINKIFTKYDILVFVTLIAYTNTTTTKLWQWQIIFKHRCWVSTFLYITTVSIWKQAKWSNSHGSESLEFPTWGSRCQWRHQSVEVQYSCQTDDFFVIYASTLKYNFGK